MMVNTWLVEKIFWRCRRSSTNFINDSYISETENRPIFCIRQFWCRRSGTIFINGIYFLGTEDVQIQEQIKN